MFGLASTLGTVEGMGGASTTITGARDSGTGGGSGNFRTR